MEGNTFESKAPNLWQIQPLLAMFRAVTLYGSFNEIWSWLSSLAHKANMNLCMKGSISIGQNRIINILANRVARITNQWNCRCAEL